jgi:energy-coupling factor transport system substrate-specific component
MKSNTWKLKDILMVAIVGVLFSFLYLGMDYLGLFLTSALTPVGWGAIGYEPIFGVWYMAAAFCIYVIQKPGVGIVAELIASILEVLMGNWFGPMVIVTGLVQGFSIELGFMVYKYKKFGTKQLILGALFAAWIGYAWNTIRSQYYLLEPKVIIVMIIIRTISAVIFAALLTKLLADGLAKAGVLNAYALGQEKSQPMDEELSDASAN